MGVFFYTKTFIWSLIPNKVIMKLTLNNSLYGVAIGVFKNEMLYI